MTYDISQSVPIITTRQLSFEVIITELLKFCKLHSFELDNICQKLKKNLLNIDIVMPIGDKLIIQFYVEKVLNYEHLSFQIISKSAEIVKEVSFTMIYYTILVYILALKCNMKPAYMTYISGYAYLDKIYLSKIEEQISKTSRPFPKLNLEHSIKTKDFTDLIPSDFELIGYMPHIAINMDTTMIKY